ncbi:hypothetical protein CGLO_18034 [Colletotrichum gloeosporioides Cg-14]|uniref:Uncharacterized protein n=1 Tax=Colletotrichum gloeosporioides (strain Cg-14) TaxID=1237896 RepID=T0KVF9_COLGC|nr:hypothetical protein CGLO_18034 [Colletotrichum gloeosporioides Cg-14]
MINIILRKKSKDS